MLEHLPTSIGNVVRHCPVCAGHCPSSEDVAVFSEISPSALIRLNAKPEDRVNSGAFLDVFSDMCLMPRRGRENRRLGTFVRSAK